MGIINKNNTEERIKWAEYYISTAIPCIVWDNQYFDNRKSISENFGLYKRGEGKWFPEELIDAYVESSKTKMETNPKEKFEDS